ncbi:MAG: hypothetical protein LCH51_07305 [Bacteroidetes bacterium]|nr:hypothetical protein [Bacteroidota bacterium]HOA36944.1 hypothetical protein [Flavihumibacter sp.]
MLLKYSPTCLLVGALLASTCQLHAQTETDAIMMNRTQFCAGFLYNHSSWNEYWEGTRKRNNLNLGTVTNQSVMFMANYGITDNLNVMVGAPYVWTNASAGTLKGMKGVQDLSLNVKWRGLNYAINKKSKLALYAIGGFSTPLQNYVIDYLPLSVGLGSTNFTGRLMVDYKYNRWFATLWGAYTYRNNIKLDRADYYDTEGHNGNEVRMPDQSTFQLRAGYRGKYLIAEATLTRLHTIGGFDITRNNMPFPSNQMNSSVAGAGFKYTLKQHTNLSFLGSFGYTFRGLDVNGNYFLDSRNVGKSTSFSGGIFYAIYTKKSARKTANNNTNQP